MPPNRPLPVVTDVDRDGGRGRPVPSHLAPWRRETLGVLAVVSAGGTLGALARYGLGVALPHPAGGFDGAILAVNVSGCLLIGVLMVLVTEVFTAQRLLRPFLGVGVLGGYTTFSTSIVDVQRAAVSGHAAAGLGYLASTLAGAMLAVWAGTAATTWLLTAHARKAGGQR